MSNPDFVEKPGFSLEALPLSEHVETLCAYPSNIIALPSYSSEPSASTYSRNLRKLVKHSLAHSWKYDPVRCSVKAAFQFGQDRADRPSHGLTQDEFVWATGGKLATVTKVRSIARMDCEQVKKTYLWVKNLDEGEEPANIEDVTIEREIDEFYSSDGADFRPTDTDHDEGFSEPSSIATTIVSLPDKPLVEERDISGGIFQDSGISMDERYAEYSLAHSDLNSTTGITRQAPTDWPTFEANVAPLRPPMKQGRWLGLVGDQKQCAWPGRRQSPPYDLQGLRSRDVHQIMDDPSDNNTNKSPRPADVAPPPKTGEAAQTVSETVQGKVNSEVADSAPQSCSHEKTLVHHDKNKDPITEEVSEHDVTHSASDKQSQPVLTSVENSDCDGSPVFGRNMTRKFAHINIDANAHARRSIHSPVLSTPVNHRPHQIDETHLATPATININLTPKSKSSTNTPDASDRSGAIRLLSSPTTNTQKGQSALSRYQEETASHSSLSCQNSSTMSFEGGGIEDISPISTPEHLRQPGNHTGFHKAVKSFQEKNDAEFTLSPLQRPQNVTSPRGSAPVPVTPDYRNGSASFRPTTPFQPNTSTLAELSTPRTPTPAPKSSRMKHKSVRNVFKSSELGKRSPERGEGGEEEEPSSDFVFVHVSPAEAATATATASTAVTSTTGGGTPFPARGSSAGSAGLLFQKSSSNKRGMKNVFNSLKVMGSEQMQQQQRRRQHLQKRREGSGMSELQTMDDDDGNNNEDEDDFEDELAGGGAETYGIIGRPSAPREPSSSNVRPGGDNQCGAHVGSSGKKTAQTVGMPRVRAREDDEDEGEDEGIRSQDAGIKDHHHHYHEREPPKKKPRRSGRIAMRYW